MWGEFGFTAPRRAPRKRALIAVFMHHKLHNIVHKTGADSRLLRNVHGEVDVETPICGFISRQ